MCCLRQCYGFVYHVDTDPGSEKIRYGSGSSPNFDTDPDPGKNDIDLDPDPGKIDLVPGKSKIIS